MPTGTATSKRNPTSKTKTASKVKTSTAKSKEGRITTKITKKDEELIKKRLKNLLQKEGVFSSKPSTSKSSSGCSSGSCLTAKKTTLSSDKSPSCSSGKCYFKKKDDNVNKNKVNSTAKAKPKTVTTKKKTDIKSKANSTAIKKTTTAAAKKTTTTTAAKKAKPAAAKKKSTTSNSNTQYSCSNGQCTLKPKPKPKAKPSSTASKSTVDKVKCTTGGCFFLKASTSTAKKTNSISTTSKRKAPEVNTKYVPTKISKSDVNSKSASTKALKSTKKLKTKQTATKSKTNAKKTKTNSIAKKSKTNIKTNPAKKKISKSCTPCNAYELSDSSEDYDYSDEDDSDDFSSSDDENDFDSDEDSSEDDDGYAGGENCRSRPSSNRKYSSYDNSDSWESASEESFNCQGGGCPFVKKRPSNINNKEDGNIVEENNEFSLVPVDRITDRKSPSPNEYNTGEEDTSFSSDYSEEESSSDEEMSYEDSEYSPSDYSFNESSNDGDYQLPDSEAEDVYIRNGDAKTYPLDGESDINFDSDASSLQLIEISSKQVFSKTLVNEKIDGNDSDSSCPQLVPIQESRAEENQVPEEFSYLSELESECESIEQGPKMVAHIFNVSKEYSEKHKNESFGKTNFTKVDRKSNSNDFIDLSPIEKIAYKLENMDSSNYKIITTRKPSINLNEHVSNSSINYENRDSDKKTGSSQLNSLKSSHTIQPNTDPVADVTPEKFSEFNSKFYNAVNSCQVLVLLKDYLYIYGTLKLRLIAGSVEVFGYKPKINEISEIFSPRGTSSVYIKPAESKMVDNNEVRCELTRLNDNFMKTDLAEIIELFDETSDAIILLERNDRNQQVEMVRKYLKENLFPNMNCISLERPFHASEFILRCILYVSSQNAIRINPNWETVNVCGTSKILVIGGKGVGKSTLVRYLINRNLHNYKKFLLIDLDIGQPEVFIPQTISATLIKNPLLGPGCYCGLNPERSYLFGDINVVLSPISYLKNVKELIEWCQKEEKFKHIPWIINTMGYNKGFGSELISVITELLEPSDIIQIQSSKQINNFDYNMSPEIIKSIPRNIFSDQIYSKERYEPLHEFFLFESIVTKESRSNWDMTAKDMRFAIIISRLGTVLAGRHEWLSDVRPVCASIENLDIICFTEDNMKKDDLLDVINANLVYLCRKGDKHVECYGIGIVRGIDRFQQKIYLLPTIQFAVLKNVDSLAVCNIPLPSSIILNQGPQIKNIAPYTYNTNDFVASKHINQIYYRAQQFLQSTPRRVL